MRLRTGTRQVFTPRSVWDSFSPKSAVKGMTVYRMGMRSPSLVIDSCICDSISQSRTSDIGYVSARSAQTTSNRAATTSATMQARS